MKQWGKNISVLTNRPDIRPSVPVQGAMGSIRVKDDRNIAIQKRAAAMSQGGQSTGSKRNMNEGAAAGLEAQDRWDENNVVLFSGVTQRLLWKGVLRRSRSTQRTWRIGGLQLRESQT